jgi:hypothetical protein
LNEGNLPTASIAWNELPALGRKYPILEIARAISSVSLKWPDFFPDYSLQEARDLSLPFAPSNRQTITNGGFFNVTVDPTGTKSGFFQLKPK